MNADRSAVVQAWAWRTPLGGGTEALLRLRNGEIGLSDDGRHRTVGRIPGEPPSIAEGRYLHRVALFAWETALEVAVRGPDDRLGVYTGLGGLRALWHDLDVAMAKQRADGANPWANGLGKVHPFWMLRHLSNNLHALLAIRLGARGEGTTVAGPTGGAGALAAAIRALHLGVIDRALVVASDTLLQPELLLEGALHHRFDTAAPGEAAVTLLLTRDGPGPRVSVHSGAGRPPWNESGIDLGPQLGDLGAATALAQVVALLSTGGFGWSHGAPGLWARVEVTT